MDMATSIKVAPDTKRLLDELQADLTREVGRKVTLQELTGALAELGHRERDRLVAAFVDRPPRLTKAQVRRLLSRAFDGPPTRADDLDRWIYGKPHGVRGPNVWEDIGPARGRTRPPGRTRSPALRRRRR